MADMVVVFNRFPEIAAKFGPALDAIVAKTAFDLVANVQGFIRANGQIDTSFMINSVHVEPKEQDYSRTVQVGAYYAWYQNYGTHNADGTQRLKARPFWEPGIEQTRPGFAAALAAVESKLVV